MSLLLQTLFKVSPAAAVDILKVAKSVLEHWYATYMQVREKIEISGRDARWEFSKQMLFERTNFMVCACHLPQDPLRLAFEFVGLLLGLVTLEGIIALQL